MSKREVIAAIQSIIEHNASCIGEEPDIGVHLLRDGRVRIYELERGWQHWPYREYESVDRALKAARKASRTAEHVAALIANGVPKAEALDREAYR